LTAVICVLTGKYLGTKRRVRDMLHDLYGVDICIGSISNLEQEVSRALASPVEEAAQHVRTQHVANGDETGWYQGRSEGRAARAWLWTVVTHHVTVFRIAMSRGADVAQEMLGETFAGILGTDRWGAYSWIDARRRQLCWSHLIRDFQAFVDRRGVSAQIGNQLIEQVDLMFRWWHRIRDGTMTRSAFQRQMKPVEKKIYALLEDAEARAGGKTAGMAKRMLTLRGAFFTFVHEDGIEPTNNISERTIRHGVIWRKISFGTQSPDGSRYVERMLSVVATLRQQNRNVLEYITAAYTAHLNGVPPPSLLPPT
jgi:transposase